MVGSLFRSLFVYFYNGSNWPYEYDGALDNTRPIAMFSIDGAMLPRQALCSLLTAVSW